LHLLFLEQSVWAAGVARVHGREGEETSIGEIIAKDEARLHDGTRGSALADAELASLVFSSTQGFSVALFVICAA
jgi:hypothetical protein